MAIDPRSIQIKDTATAMQLAETTRLLLVTVSDHWANQMIQIHPRIVARFKAEGLDGTNRLGFGSSASKTASAIIQPGKRLADGLESVGVFAKAFAHGWQELYATPIEIAEQMKKHSGAQMMGR
jgi:hypothetical protein